MNRVVRKALAIVGVLIGLIVIAAIGIGLFFDVNRYKPQIQAAVAKSTGMSLRIQGKASLKIFPHLRIALRDVHLSNPEKPAKRTNSASQTQGASELFAAQELLVTPRLLPFIFHHEMIVDQVSLMSPKIHIEKDAQGRMNYEPRAGRVSQGSAAGRKGSGAGQVHSLKIRDGELTYTDLGTGQKTQLSGVNGDISNIAWNPAGLMKSLVFTGKADAKTLKAGSLSASDLKAGIRADHGVITLDPTEATAFGGLVQGNARLDLRSATPKIRLAQTATHLDLSQIPAAQSGRISGNADAKLDLSASGRSSQALTRTADGTLSIRSRNVTVNGVDIDAMAKKLKAAQGLNVIGIASALVAGPLAQQAGQAAGIAAPVSGAKSVIQNLVADWKISNGIARASDVAFSTGKTTIAFQGAVNLVNRTYQDLTIARVDEKGCAKEKVEIAGPLSSPHPTAASLGRQAAKSITGSIGTAVGKEAGNVASGIAGLFGGDAQKALPPPQPEASAPSKKQASGCDRFYAGSLLQG